MLFLLLGQVHREILWMLCEWTQLFPGGGGGGGGEREIVLYAQLNILISIKA